jgi:DNA-binding MarR family transcriptional regulator/N-acetylglutamate synthase-like GNAT family acetyltransferase
MTLTDEVRSFNRFYTREIGLLNRCLPATDLSLPEARVLYELAQAPQRGRTAAEIGRALGMDKAHLSRIVARFLARGLATSQVSPDHRKHRLLILTNAGREVFAAAEAAARAQVDALLKPIDANGHNRLIGAMRDIRVALGDRETTDGELRDWTYEGLASRILGAFVAQFDASREDSWVTERGGAIVGSIFLMKSDDPGIAKLRLLYVEPSARGGGVGRRLVATCIARARELGYRELTLWTNDVLVAARRLYQAAGFRLVSEEPHRSFGHDLVGQTWTLDLG